MNAKTSYTENVHAGRIEIMKDLEALQKLDDPQADENYRDPLCIDTHVIKKILLSTGGPEDGFKLTFDIVDGKQLELSYGVYYRADWGEYQESTLSESEAQTVYDFYMGGYAEL